MSGQVWLVLEVIIQLFLIILLGLFLRKGGLLNKNATEKLSRFVVEIAFPALVFTSVLRTVDRQSLARDWHLPLLGMAVLLLGMGIGYILARPLLSRESRGSAAFAIGVPNWLFIPLPIAIALYGAQGERIVLLINVGALLAFWSAGVWIVRGGKPDLASLRRLALNSGLLATLLGIAAAVAFPWMRSLEETDLTAVGPELALPSIVIQAIALVGGTTVPLAMITTGALLAGSGTRSALDRKVIGVAAVRLVVVPAVAVLLLWLAQAVGVRLDQAASLMLVIVAAMPVAVTCSVVTEKYEGDVSLVSGAIFLSTSASIVTVPLVVWLMRDLLLPAM
jgi:predicted permease